MRIVKTNFIAKGFDAFTVCPIIFVRPEKADDHALIAHEIVHYCEQEKMGVALWLARYAASKTFRLEAEVRAYKRQIELGGITVEKAAQLLTQYKLGISHAEAVAKLKEE